jgi:Asp-tRNA(Asn)/Glu-tRNA(Gln) amidotransferase A subunit family amidase
LQEFARGGMSISSLGGQVRNPYDLSRTPGGSSGGTGAAIAVNFAVLGTGSDTGQSVRSPASANNLVGIRSTRGLVSRAGVIPNGLTQDEVGPIARTVTDAALLLDVMAGYDATDPITAFGKGHIPTSYAQLLGTDALRGARIGVITNLFGTAERHKEVNQVMESVIASDGGSWRHDCPLRPPGIRRGLCRGQHLAIRGAHRHGPLFRDPRPRRSDQELCGAGRCQDLRCAEDA